MDQKSCIRCRQTYKENDLFCISCGAPVINKCTFDGGLLDDPCTKINPHNAVFVQAVVPLLVSIKKGLLLPPIKQ